MTWCRRLVLLSKASLASSDSVAILVAVGTVMVEVCVFVFPGDEVMEGGTQALASPRKGHSDQLRHPSEAFGIY